MVLSFEHLTKFYADNLIIKDASGSVNNGDRIGIVGQNGCGKTTLLNVLFENEPYENGKVYLSSKCVVGYLKQNSHLDSDSTIYNEMKKAFSDLNSAFDEMKMLENKIADTFDENYEKNLERYTYLSTFFEQRDGYNTDVKIKTILNGMGFSDKDLQTPVNTLSGGERTRLCLARLLLIEPDALVLDEPTNHLDIKTLTWLEEYLSSYKGTIITVSHDRFFLDKAVNTIWEISDGRLRSFKGNYSKYLRLKEEADTRALKEYEAQNKELEKLKTYAEKNIARASTSKSAKSRLAAIDRIQILDDPRHLSKKMKMRFDYDFEPNFEVLKVKELKLSVGIGADEKCLCENVSFDLLRGDKLAIIGANGTGKSTLLKKLKPYPSVNKAIKWGGNVKIAYYDQHLQMLNGENTVEDELWSHFPNMDHLSVRTALGRALFSDDTVYKKVSMLSGGERARLCIAEIMLMRPNVLIMDEPTNHLDLNVREILENALGEFAGTLIIVSHDRYLLSKIPNKILNLENNNAEFFKGGYNDFISSVKNEVQEIKICEKEKTENQNYRSKKKRAEDAQRRNEISKLEKEITALDEQIKQIEEELSNPQIYSDFEKSGELCTLLEQKKCEHDEKFEKWFEITDE